MSHELRAKMLFLLMLVIALGGGLATFCNAVELEETPPPAIIKIDFLTDESVNIIEIHSTEKTPDVALFTMKAPDRIVIDFNGFSLGNSVTAPKSGTDLIHSIRIGRHTDKIRIVADLAALSKTDYETVLKDHVFIVRVTHGNDQVLAEDAAPSPPATQPTKPTEQIPPTAYEDQTAEETDSREENEETPAGNDIDDLWAESRESEDNGVLASDLWDNGDEGNNEAESADDLWGDAPGTESGGSAASDLWGEAPGGVEEPPGADDLWGGGDTDAESGYSKSRFEIGGRFRILAAADIEQQDDFEDDGYGHAELILETEWKPGNRVQLVAAVDADVFGYLNEGDVDSDATIRLHDAYINYGTSRLNLKLGNQTVRWGKTDGFSPLDNLNPEDYRDGIAGRREDRKLPIPMANLEVYQGNMTFQGIFIPYFFEPELDLTGSDWAVFQHADAMFPGFHAVAKNIPRSLDSSEFGIRISGILNRLDYAISWFQALEDLPVPNTLWTPPGFVLPPGELSPIDLAAYAATTGQAIELARDQQNIFGLEAETTLGAFGIRADAAYVDSSSFQTEDLIRIQKAALQYMIGIDYNSPRAWYVNLQFSQTRIEDYEDRILWAENVTNALIGTFRKTLDDGNWEIECRGYYDLSGDATLVNPKLVIAHWQPIRLEICGEFFDGSVENPVGFYSNNDQVYGVLGIKF